MAGNEFLLIVYLGGAIILGLVGTVAYYFARYGFPDDKKTLPPQESTETPSQKAFVDQKASVEKVDLNATLKSTRQSLWGRLKEVLHSGKVSGELRDQIEEILYTSDLGVPTVERLMGAIEKKLSSQERADSEAVRLALKQEILSVLQLAHAGDLNLDLPTQKPLVVLIVGVNGAGKTTTIGKLAFAWAQSGKKVLVAAGDTFRAAAGEQLKVWTERAQVEIYSPEGVSEPAAVAYAALQQAVAHQIDIVLIDTAGRLHTQKNLMEELKKIKRVLSKNGGQAPHETLLILDANSGQNALVQAKEFNQALGLTGVVLTKMDGTAKGGIAVSLAFELGLAPKWIGVGEGTSDLQPFRPQEYVDAILI